MLGKCSKSEFDDVITLHAYISEPTDRAMIGTAFHLTNIKNSDIAEAEDFFLKFNNETIIENTRYGSVLRKQGDEGKIFINGLWVATEDNFLFSYNITFLNASIKRALNRERISVGRAAYANVVKSILLECKSEEVGWALTAQLSQYSYGNIHDELKWIDVQEHAARILNKYKKAVFVTSEEMQRSIDLVNEAKEGGAEIVVIPQNLSHKIAEQNMKEDQENKVPLFSEFVRERNQNFEFHFVNENALSYSEKQVFSKKDRIFNIIGGKPSQIKSVVVSETMQKDTETFRPAEGLWEPENQRIIIWRQVLKNEENFLATLLHEIAHAISGAKDATRPFEDELTILLGILGK
jgi:hypothetical protein